MNFVYTIYIHTPIRGCHKKKLKQKKKETKNGIKKR